MAKILLDYFFPITAISPTPQASTAFLKQVLAVVKPKSGVTPGTVSLATSAAQVQALTDNTDVLQLFSAGLTRVYVLPVDTLDLDEILAAQGSLFYTLLISSDFTDADMSASQASVVKGNLTFTAKAAGFAGNDIQIEFLNTGVAGSEVVTVVGKKITVSMQGGTSTAAQLKTAIDAKAEAAALISVAVAGGQGGTAQAAFALSNLVGGDDLDLGAWKGVVGVSSDDLAFLAAQAVIEGRVAFQRTDANGAKNMFYAFGKLLSNPTNWTNQQYIQMPFAEDVDTLGEANNLFDSKISFVLSDTEFGNRLGLFAAGGKAITAPYITRNLEIDLQSRALSYISGNQPAYTLTQAALLEDELQKVISGEPGNPGYIGRQWIDAGVVEIRLEQQNFVASGYINISEPNAMWRIFGEIRQTL